MLKSSLYPSARIRNASSHDLKKLLELDQASFEYRWSREQFLTALQGLCLVYEEKNEVIGFVCAGRSATAQQTAKMRVAVHPSYQGMGIIAELIQAALNELKSIEISSF